ncbi:hypothetical protein RUND412_002242 [Rhizina undulata]
MKTHSFGFFLATATAFFAPTVIAAPTPDDVSPASTSLFTRQNSYTPIVGSPGGIQSRLPLVTLQTQYPDVFNMYLLALVDFQAMAESNVLSYYQISGIHGRPYIPWQYPASATQDPNTGYCTHGSALFATWHRPYLVLFEQTLYQHAQTVAAKFKGTSATRYQTAAKSLRVPYWDWATSGGSIPAVVMQPKITVTRPNAQGQPTTAVIANPLYTYNFTTNSYLENYFAGSFSTLTSTRRSPNSATGVSNDAASNSGMMQTYTSRRQNTYNLFSIPNFSEFSSTAASANNTPNAYTSLESIHNDIHGIVGGNLGHMAYIDYAAFDPIFWLHHAQVDRLAAMYQAVFPSSLVQPQPASGTFANAATPGKMDTITTSLYPFRHTNGVSWTSRDVSYANSIWSYGYSYPEIPASYQNRNPSDLKTFVGGRINALYGSTVSPGQNFANAPQDTNMNAQRTEWIVHVTFDQAQILGTFQVVVFIGMGSCPADPSTWQTSPNLVGGATAFGNLGSPGMSHEIKASVPLTQTLINLNIGLDPSVVVSYLQKNLAWCILQNDNSVPLSSLSSLVLGVSSTVVQFPKNANDLPVWGTPQTYTQITNGKAGGLDNNEKSPYLSSVFAPAVPARPNDAPSSSS